MVLFKPYSSIKDFLYRYTIIKIGNLHIRLHKIVDEDKTTLLHNHPFNYISIILKGGYTETHLDNNKSIECTHNFLSVIHRDHNVFHRIDRINSKTITLFIAYGKYSWSAFNTNHHDDSTDGIYERIINDKKIWCKRINGIWHIGNTNKIVAENETRHSIHQCD